MHKLHIFFIFIIIVINIRYHIYCVYVCRSLQCYRSAKDLLPQLEMGLQGCQVLYRPRTSRGLQHELRVSDATQTLVLGLNDPQEASDWKRVRQQEDWRGGAAVAQGVERVDW